MPNFMPNPRVASFFLFSKVILILSPFEKLHHSLFYLSILLLTFFSSTQFIFPALLSCAVARTAESPPNSSTWACFAAAQSLMWFLLFVVFMDTYRNVVVSNKIQTVPVRKMYPVRSSRLLCLV